MVLFNTSSRIPSTSARSKFLKINPFSPIPSSYLYPSSQSSDKLLPKTKRARHTDRGPTQLNSPTQDSNQLTAISWKDQHDEVLPSSPSGAKSSDILLPSPSKGQRKRKATTQPPAVAIGRKKRAKRGRYLDDFEEVKRESSIVPCLQALLH